MIPDASHEIRNRLSPEHKTRALLLYKMVSNNALETTVFQKVSTGVLWLFTQYALSASYSVFSLPQNITDTPIFDLLSTNTFLQFGRVSDMCIVTQSQGEAVF
jgi:hypothetical protein